MLGNVRARDTAHLARNAPPDRIVLTPWRLACQLKLIEASKRKTILEAGLHSGRSPSPRGALGNWSVKLPLAMFIERCLLSKTAKRETKLRENRAGIALCDLPRRLVGSSRR